MTHKKYHYDSNFQFHNCFRSHYFYYFKSINYLDNKVTYVGLGRFVPEPNSTMYRTSYPDIKVHAYKISLVVACFAISFAYPIPKFIFLEFRNISIINICCCCWPAADIHEEMKMPLIHVLKRAKRPLMILLACVYHRHASKCVEKGQNITCRDVFFPRDGI